LAAHGSPCRHSAQTQMSLSRLSRWGVQGWLLGQGTLHSTLAHSQQTHRARVCLCLASSLQATRSWAILKLNTFVGQRPWHVHPGCAVQAINDNLLNMKNYNVDETGLSRWAQPRRLYVANLVARSGTPCDMSLAVCAACPGGWCPRARPATAAASRPGTTSHGAAWSISPPH
jgi:hypothetical protein